MNKKSIVRTLLLALVLVLGFVSCERRPLHDMVEKVRIRVKVNVKAVTNVTTDIYNPRIPVPPITTDMMRVMVYDPSTHNLLTQSFISDKEIDEEGNEVLSGDLNISYGDYDFLIYNFDTPTTQVSNENNEDKIIAYTSEISEAMRRRYFGTKADGYTTFDYDDLTINYEPDHLLVANRHQYNVSPHDTVVVINAEAGTVVDSYYIQIRVEGAQYMAADGATAVITGLSPSNRFGLNLRTEEPSAAVIFDLVKSTDDNIPGENKDVICAVFNTFGKIEHVPSDLHVTFNVIDVSGRLQTYDTSLNEIFQTDEAKYHHWLLINEVFRINPPEVGEQGKGGFQPQVDDWVEEQGEIVL